MENIMNNKIRWLIIICLLALPGYSWAGVKTIQAEHEYTMGDNDSKNDARRFCFMEAKRKVLDRAGVWIESRTDIKDHQLIRDEIKTYSAALLKVKIVDEKWRMVAQSLKVWLRVQAEVDMNHIQKKLAEIDQNVLLQKKIREQQRKLVQLEEKLMALQKNIQGAGTKKAAKLRRERDSVYLRIEEIEASSMEKFWRK